ncbi:hypothetical protein [Flavobacterium sp.]|jgi:alpha-tubulin suppressor-like RCC1 family protein|uniref:hypothetical protein n=1 Tax=Flavobacterium sp. TaxID=239 RepID=UPI0037BF819F
MKKTIILIILILGSLYSQAQCWSTISAGNYHTAAIAPNGTLWTWGRNLYGQLGDGTTTNRNTPTQIGTATNWLKVEAGEEFTKAIKTNGTLWAW